MVEVAVPVPVTSAPAVAEPSPAPAMPPAAPVVVRAPWSAWVAGLLLVAWFGAWWLHLRPGVFSYDSGYYLAQVVSGDLENQKPFLYTRFLQLTSLGGQYLQLSVFFQVALVVAMLARAFALALAHRVWVGWLVLCAILVANPYVAGMAYYMQNDVLFCFAIIAILLETLQAVRRGYVTGTALVVIGIAAPMAFGFRTNGMLFLPLWLLVLPLLLPRLWRRMALTAVATTVLAYVSIVGVDRSKSHEILYPAIIHETVRLAQPGHRYELGGRLSPQTRALVGDGRLRQGVGVYWPLYWDTIGFLPGGPELAMLPKQQRKAIVSSFLRKDLLPNLPSIAGHRLEILVGALLAQAEVVDPYAAPLNLPPALRDWKDRTGRSARGHGLLGRWVDASMASRNWSWNAAFGAVVLLGLTLLAAWRRDKAMLAIVALLWVQVAALLAVAPSAEYRYVFMVYLAPLLLLAGHRYPGVVSGRSLDPAIQAR